MPRVCILDYGAGNVRSVYNLFSQIDADPVVSNRGQDLADATHLVLPGVGAFAESMRLIRQFLPVETIEREVLACGKPFLGICVGMQVLATRGTELGGADGFGWVSGTVDRLDTGGLRLPHIGWNTVRAVRDDAVLGPSGSEGDVYYVHSFAFRPDDPSTVVGTTCYGEEFCAAVRKENIFGVQFHPEKSQPVGRKMLENFVALR